MVPERVRIRIAAAGAAGVLAATLTGCGSEAYVPLTASNLASAMTAATSKVHTGHEVSTGSGATTTVDFDTSGTFKYRLSQTAAGSSAKTLLGVGGDRYLQESGVTPTGKWLKLARSSAVPVITFAQLNPVAMVARLNKGATKFAYVGTAVIGGATVYHYRITIDQQKLLRATGQSQGTANLGANESITENLYLNRDNTPRRVILALPAGVGSTQFDVTGWGAPVSIQAPPPSAVVTSVAPK